ncbi:MAG: DegV family protein [Clostridia bacterium]|nr:DegV family protein [Clostridia bacterium]MBQ2347282.1 DegV family protein [Clostridia bacterium]MBQ5440498.1 DegV family protein [Clostridia bacterium]
MSTFSIVTDTGCDMPSALAEKLKVSAVPLKVIVAGKETDSSLKKLDIDNSGFYDIIRKGIDVKTSSPSLEDFLRYFKKELNKGKDILYIGFSTGLSGTYNVGRIAAEELSEEYPDRKILTIDSLCGSMGQALLLYYCVQKQREGATLEETYVYAEKLKLHVCHWFTVDDLHHLKKGGRISPTVAFVGSVMNIKPVLQVDTQGKLAIMYKARGKKIAIAKLVEQMGERFNPDENDIIFINHADCPEDAELLARSITKNYGITNFVISEIGPTFGAHSGPGAVALFYIGNR